MLHKLLFVIVLSYLITVAVLSILLFRASPGPRSQEILGVGLGHTGPTYGNVPGAVYLSGRRLTCTTLPSTARFRSICRIEIAGKPLAIAARRNLPSDPYDLGGSCTAFYDQQSWPCVIGSRHIGVHWFAHINPPLGLSPDQLELIRRQYPLDNLSEQAALHGSTVVTVVSTLLAMISTGAWLWPVTRQRLTVLLAALVVGGGAFVISGVLALIATSGFWD